MSPFLEDLIKKHHLFRDEREEKEGSEPTVHVDEIASKVASFYEKTRKLIDYQEEHLLRKSFIKRALSRRMAFSENGDIAEALIKDIIRAGHLPNDSVPKTKIKEVKEVLKTFRVLRGAIKNVAPKRRKEVSAWISGMSVSAIEEQLFPPSKDSFLSEFMFGEIRKNLVIHGADVSDKDINTQLFVAIQKELLRVDKDQLCWRLLKFSDPDIAEHTQRKREYLADNIEDIYRGTIRALNNKFSAHFSRLCSQWNTVFYILGDAITSAKSTSEAEAILRDPQEMEARLAGAYRRRYAKERGKLRRLALFTVISLFVSKVAIALAIEIPIEKYILGDFSATHTLLNIFIPPILLVIIVLAIRLPSSKNKKLVIKECMRVAQGGKDKDYIITIHKPPGPVAQATVRLMYVIMFIAIFYWLGKILLSFGFSIPGIIVFDIFVSLVAATGMKVWNRSKEISLEKRKPTLVSFIIDLFAVPFISIGRFVIAGLSRFNIFVAIANILVDVPFQIFVEFLENFRSFLKGKKDELS